MNDTFDLVALVPGADEKATLEALLSHRQASLGIRQLRCRVLKHHRRDPGCFHEAPDVLRGYARLASHALVLLDREGSGQEHLGREEIAADLRHRLTINGWNDRAAAIVVDPELEVWVWSDSPWVENVLGWKQSGSRIRQWLIDRGWPADRPKPTRPKECLEAVLRQTTRRFSSSIFGELAQSVGLEDCTDPAFVDLRSVLRAWFPQ
jgi:hypothetical protein